MPVTNATVGSSSIAPMVLPHVLQKARLEYEEDRQIEGLPPGPTHSTFCAGNSTHVRVSEPECLRQLSHEHVCGFPGSPVARNLIEPQMQPPSYCLVFISRLRQNEWCLIRLTSCTPQGVRDMLGSSKETLHENHLRMACSLVHGSLT